MQLTDQFNLIPGLHSGHNKVPRDSTVQGVIPVTMIYATEKKFVSTKVRPLGPSARQLRGQSMNCAAPLRVGFEFSENKTQKVLVGSLCVILSFRNFPSQEGQKKRERSWGMDDSSSSRANSSAGAGN